jgi:hypothetical protein
LKKDTISVRYGSIICGLLFPLFFEIQFVCCSDGGLTLRCSDHPEWLDLAAITIDDKPYAFDTLPERLSAGSHFIKCRYRNWIFKQAVDIQVGQNNIIYVKFQKKQCASDKITVDETKTINIERQEKPPRYKIEPGKEGNTRPGTVNVVIEPLSVQEKANIWVTSLYTKVLTQYEEKKFSLPPGDYQIDAIAEGYLIAGRNVVTVPSGGYVNLKLFLEEDYGILKINISPHEATNTAKIHSKELAAEKKKKEDCPYEQTGLKFKKGEYEVYVSAKGYVKSAVEKVTVPPGRQVTISITLKPVISSVEF